jgi:integrase/recombinase XerD
LTLSVAPIPNRKLTQVGLDSLPALVARAGERASWRFIEFFAANIRNKNTRAAYVQAVGQFFAWCDRRGISALSDLNPVVIAAYIEGHPGSAPTVKQHLAAIRMLFDWLVIGQIVPMNPAASVRGPKHVVSVGKTPVLQTDQARQLLDSIATDSMIGLRDRAIIGFMCYTFARVSATVGMKVKDYFESGKRWRVRLHEKGGKEHVVPAHHNAEAYLDAYVLAADIGDQGPSPLFRAVDRHRQITDRPLSRHDILRMIKRRARAAGLPSTTTCHTMRATGITALLMNDGRIEKAQIIAGHASPRTTKLYDRSGDEITLDEVERIAI